MLIAEQTALQRVKAVLNLTGYDEEKKLTILQTNIEEIVAEANKMVRGNTENSYMSIPQNTISMLMKMKDKEKIESPTTKTPIRHKGSSISG